MLQSLVRYFLHGLLLTAPIALTIALIGWVVVALDGVLKFGAPGVGIALTIALITGVGFLSSNVFGRKLFDLLEKAIGKMPIVKLLYGSLRDLFEAFVGEKKRFSRPVVVDLDGHGSLFALGFLTGDETLDPSLAGLVSVYLPQSYNVAGNLLLVPSHRVRALEVDSGELMSFVVSGGVTKLHLRDDDQPSWGSLA